MSRLMMNPCTQKNRHD